MASGTEDRSCNGVGAPIFFCWRSLVTAAFGATFDSIAPGRKNKRISGKPMVHSEHAQIDLKLEPWVAGRLFF